MMEQIKYILYAVAIVIFLGAVIEPPEPERKPDISRAAIKARIEQRHKDFAIYMICHDERAKERGVYCL